MKRSPLKAESRKNLGNGMLLTSRRCSHLRAGKFQNLGSSPSATGESLHCLAYSFQRVRPHFKPIEACGWAIGVRKS